MLPVVLLCSETIASLENTTIFVMRGAEGDETILIFHAITFLDLRYARNDEFAMVSFFRVTSGFFLCQDSPHVR